MFVVIVNFCNIVIFVKNDKRSILCFFNNVE